MKGTRTNVLALTLFVVAGVIGAGRGTASRSASPADSDVRW